MNQTLVGPEVVPVLPNSGRPRSRRIVRGAALDDALEDVDDLIGGHRIDHLAGPERRPRHRPAVPVGRVAALAGPRVGAPDDPAVAVLDIVDQGRGQRPALIGEDREGVDHLAHRGVAGAERDGEIRGDSRRPPSAGRGGRRCSCRSGWRCAPSSGCATARGPSASSAARPGAAAESCGSISGWACPDWRRTGRR